MKEFFKHIHSSKKLQAVFYIGFLVQLIFCFTSVGYFHPDQHFQIIEFSSYQLGKSNAGTRVWEFASHIRPTIQVYFFSGYRYCCELLGITNAFTQLTILRLLQGCLLFYIFNWLAFFYCKHNSKKLFIVLLLINFTWLLPYTRTLFSSEMFAAIFFFPAIVWFHNHCEQKTVSTKLCLTIGLLLAISFFIRFQIVFGIIGFGYWLLFFKKQYKQLLLIVAGFAVGVGFNVLLDYFFYNQLVFTPYLYFKTNLIDGVAASFGTKSFTYYLAILVGIITAPPLSIYLFYKYAKASVINYKHPLVLTTAFFIIGHCCVGHKEERFLFTIFNVLPVIISLPQDAFNFLGQATFKMATQIMLGLSVLLNFVLLALFIVTPYSQTIAFDNKLSKQLGGSNTPIIYCYTRTPLQTESHLPLTFYKQAMGNINFISIDNLAQFNLSSPTMPCYLCGTFNDFRDGNKFDSLQQTGFMPVVYSSKLLWQINEFLMKKKMNSVNDIWVLYELKK